MTSDKDLIRKGAVKGILTTRIRGFEVSYADDRRITFDPRELFAAIDALEPVEECQDAVSRDDAVIALRALFGWEQGIGQMDKRATGKYVNREDAVEAIEELDAALPASPDKRKEESSETG